MNMMTKHENVRSMQGTYRIVCLKRLGADTVGQNPQVRAASHEIFFNSRGSPRLCTYSQGTVVRTSLKNIRT